MSVGISKGLDGYDSKSPQFSIAIKAFKKSKKSFFTFKVDNIDMAEKDLRILNYQGMPSHQGRVEFRLDGIWGSVCSKGVSPSVARLICKNLNYKDGIIKNLQGEDNSGENFCGSFRGEDFCGPEPSAIHYMNMKCEGGETDVTQCYRLINKILY